MAQEYSQNENDIFRDDIKATIETLVQEAKNTGKPITMTGQVYAITIANEILATFGYKGRVTLQDRGMATLHAEYPCAR